MSIKQFSELFKAYVTNPVFRNNIDLLMKVPIQEKDLQNEIRTLRIMEDKYFNELKDTSYEPWKPNILSREESLNLITSPSSINSSLRSFCRIGDGEVQIILGWSLPFQNYDKRLAEMLIKILTDEENDHCSVGLINVYRYFMNAKNDSLNRWKILVIPKCRECFETYCNKNKNYINAEFSMPYMKRNSTETMDYIREQYDKLKSLFKDKHLIIFAGENILKNIKYNVFERARKIDYLVAPRLHAFTVYDEIINLASKYPKDCIFGFILGPTATVLAYEMSNRGYIAYDIGHMAKDYDVFMKVLNGEEVSTSKFFDPD